MALLPVIAGFVSVPDGSPGGAAAWGDITGTLSAQTDLQSALNAKANAADISLSSIEAAAGLVPATDGTYPFPEAHSITISKGIITAIS